MDCWTGLGHAVSPRGTLDVEPCLSRRWKYAVVPYIYGMQSIYLHDVHGRFKRKSALIRGIGMACALILVSIILSRYYMDFIWV